MKPQTAFYQTSIGKKWVVALTAIPLVAYVIGHMLGNLQIFYSRTQINHYAYFLHSHPIALWAIRIFLILCFVVHIFTALRLAIENRAARPQAYAVKRNQATNFAALYMAVSGILILAFVVFHILHFTTESIDPSYRKMTDAEGYHDVHQMVVSGFQNHWIAAFYIIAMAFLCMHLSHGLSSILQTLGLNSRKLQNREKAIGLILALVIFLGFVSIPVSVLLGILK